MPTFSTINHALQFGNNSPTVTLVGTDNDGYIVYDMSTASTFYQFAPNTKYFAIKIIFDQSFVIPPAVIISPGNDTTAELVTANPGVEFFVDYTLTGLDVTTTYFNISGISASIPELGPTVLMWTYQVTGQQTGTTSNVPDFSSSPNKFLQVNNTATATQWVTITSDMIAPAWSLSISGPASPVEIGATITNPSFTASYNRAAAAAALNDGTGSIDLTVSPFTSFAYNTPPLPARTYTKSTINAIVTWTLTGNEAGGLSKSNSTTVQWQPRAYWSVIVDPGVYNAAFITSLINSALESTFARTISFSAGGGTKNLFYAFPTNFGTPASFKDTSTGFGIPFSKVASAVAVTNSFSIVIPGGYDVWRSDNPLIAAVTVQVS